MKGGIEGLIRYIDDCVVSASTVLFIVHTFEYSSNTHSTSSPAVPSSSTRKRNTQNKGVWVHNMDEEDPLECSYCKKKDLKLNMFRCKECQGSFCSAHRLTFNHFCKTTSSSNSSSELPSSSSSSGGGVKAMFKAVENRFTDEEKHLGSQTFHYQVKTTSKEDKAPQPDASFAKIEGLLATWKNDGLSEKQRSVALKTAQMLMKSKAWGDVEDVDTKDPSNRIYFMVEFMATGVKKIVYFPKRSHVRDMLHKLGRKFTSSVFGSPTIPPDTSVVCFSDNFCWQDDNWDRAACLCNCIKEFETIKIFTVSTSEAAACQSSIEQRRIVSGDTVFRTFPDNHDYGKGNKVLYETNSEHGRMEATIIGVHYDDYPNVYYTILLDDGVEKQTIASRLMPLDENTREISSSSSNERLTDDSNASTLCSTPNTVHKSTLWKVEVSHGMRGKYALDVDPEWSIGAMKVKVYELTGVSPSDQKLMCKGSMLKNDIAKIADTKITNECKISLIGNVAASSKYK